MCQKDETEKFIVIVIVDFNRIIQNMYVIVILELYLFCDCRISSNVSLTFTVFRNNFAEIRTRLM